MARDSKFRARKEQGRPKEAEGGSEKLSYGRYLLSPRSFVAMSIVHSISGTAREGLELLKRGTVALKHGRAGKPKETIFTLSADEKELSWHPKSERLGGMLSRRISSTNVAERSRRIQVQEVVELLVGRETAIFNRRGNDEGNEHLSLSLKLMGSLPAPPSGTGVPAEQPNAGRESLDVSFDSEETFGLWVAALRHLLLQLQQRHTAPAPTAPVQPAIALFSKQVDSLFAAPLSGPPTVASTASAASSSEASVDDLFRSPPKVMSSPTSSLPAGQWPGDPFGAADADPFAASADDDYLFAPPAAPVAPDPAAAAADPFATDPAAATADPFAAAFGAAAVGGAVGGVVAVDAVGVGAAPLSRVSSEGSAPQWGTPPHSPRSPQSPGGLLDSLLPEGSVRRPPATSVRRREPLACRPLLTHVDGQTAPAATCRRCFLRETPSCPPRAHIRRPPRRCWRPRAWSMPSASRSCSRRSRTPRRRLACPRRRSRLPTTGWPC